MLPPGRTFRPSCGRSDLRHRDTHKMPLTARRSSTCGKPRDLFGNIGLIRSLAVGEFVAACSNPWFGGLDRDARDVPPHFHECINASASNCAAHDRLSARHARGRATCVSFLASSLALC